MRISDRQNFLLGERTYHMKNHRCTVYVGLAQAHPNNCTKYVRTYVHVCDVSLPASCILVDIRTCTCTLILYVCCCCSSTHCTSKLQRDRATLPSQAYSTQLEEQSGVCSTYSTCIHVPTYIRVRRMYNVRVYMYVQYRSSGFNCEVLIIAICEEIIQKHNY